MARYRGGYRNNYLAYRKRGYSRGYAVRNTMGKAYRSGGGSIIFGIGGIAAGYVAPRVIPYQDLVLTAIAVLPGVLPVGKTVPWQVRRFASGYVIGTMIRGILPNIGGVSASSGGADFA